MRDTAAVYVNEESWTDMEFEVALDSGSVVHVCSLDDCRGYKLAESPGSRRGQEFLMGDGGTIPNLGQSQLNLSYETIGRDIQSVFQIAAVTRPLMSVGKICDEGHSVTFSQLMAGVHSSAAPSAYLVEFAVASLSAPLSHPLSRSVMTYSTSSIPSMSRHSCANAR